MSLRLLLIRHGLSSFNCEKRIQGRNDLSTLTLEGQEQAENVGKALKDLNISAIYSSPLQRALNTAHKISATSNSQVSPVINEKLLEINLANWSGLTVDEIQKRYPDDYKTWKNQPQELVLKDEKGEKFNPVLELKVQAKSFLKDLIERHPINKDETVLVVAHNAILRCIILLLLNEPKQGFKRVKIDNASISVLNLFPGENTQYQVQIECLNSTVHLSPSIPLKGNNSRIFLVRHGETDWNRQGRFQGQINIPLNHQGEEQAKDAGKFLSGFELTKAFSSSMTRPTQTAKAILEYHPGVQLESKKNLIEIGHGLWEGKLESEIKAEWFELLEKWKLSPQSVKMPKGESINDVWERSVRCWKEICAELQPSDTALVVAHDAVNKTILCSLLGLTPNNIWMIKQGNGGITVIDISHNPSDPAIVRCLNLTSHLGSVIDCTAEGAL